MHILRQVALILRIRSEVENEPIRTEPEPIFWKCSRTEPNPNHFLKNDVEPNRTELIFKIQVNVNKQKKNNWLIYH